MTTRTDPRPRAQAYLGQPHDAVRQTFEQDFFARQLAVLLGEAPGGRLLDLGCSDGLVAELAGERLERYVGVDLHPAAEREGCTFVAHDLSEGIGPVGEEPFDLYFSSFGVASHLLAGELEELCRDIVAHAEPGALVALEALGLFSIEWPSLWHTAPGPDRVIGYQLGGETQVHPWSAAELREIFSGAGIEPVRSVDRSIQAGPKIGDGRYFPGLPPVRAALNALLEGSTEAIADLEAPLPPLPAHPELPVARIHHALVTERRELLRQSIERSPEDLARAVWALDPETGEGYGHGLLAIGRVV